MVSVKYQKEQVPAETLSNPEHDSTLCLDYMFNDHSIPITVGTYFANGNTDLTHLYLPKNIVMGDGAFYNCANLSVVRYQGTVAEWIALVVSGKIGALTFAGTQVEKVYCLDSNRIIPLTVEG